MVKLPPDKQKGLTFTELTAALESGKASPDLQRRAAELLKRWRPKLGRPSKPYWMNARRLVDQVESLTTELGSRMRAFEALAKNKRAESVERQYRAAKAFDKADQEWIDSVFEPIGEGDEK